MSVLRVGDEVISKWGTTKVETILYLPGDAESPDDGQKVNAVNWEDEFAVDLANGHWAYGDQIKPVVPPEEAGDKSAAKKKTVKSSDELFEKAKKYAYDVWNYDDDPVIREWIADYDSDMETIEELIDYKAEKYGLDKKTVYGSEKVAGKTGGEFIYSDPDLDYYFCESCGNMFDSVDGSAVECPECGSDLLGTGTKRQVEDYKNTQSKTGKVAGGNLDATDEYLEGFDAAMSGSNDTCPYEDDFKCQLWLEGYDEAKRP